MQTDRRVTWCGVGPGVVTDALSATWRGQPGAECVLWLLVRERFLQLAHALLARDGQRHWLSPEDLLHEAFLRVRSAYLRIVGLRRGDLQALVLRVMRQTLVDWSKKPHPQIGLTVDGVVPDESELRSELVDLADCLARLERCNGLQRSIVELRVFETMTFEQIAQRLGGSESFVRQQYQAALGRLRAMQLGAGAAP